MTRKARIGSATEGRPRRDGKARAPAGDAFTGAQCAPAREGQQRERDHAGRDANAAARPKISWRHLSQGGWDFGRMVEVRRATSCGLMRRIFFRCLILSNKIQWLIEGTKTR